MKNRKMAIIIGTIFVLVCLALYFFIYIIPDISGALTETAVASYGEMRISNKYPAVVVREENVQRADMAGNVSWYVDNNIKTRKGIKVLDILGNGTSSELCPTTGVVSYYYDGYEKIFTPDTLSEVDTFLPVDEKTGERVAIEVKDVRKETVEYDDVLYKVITNDTWYTVVFVSPEEAENFFAGAKVSIGFDNEFVSATIQDVVVKEDKALVIVSTAKYLSTYDKLRECEVELVTQDEKGLIVPNTAIATVDGETGVYVKKIDGSYVFVNVKVKASNATDSVVFADQYSVVTEEGANDIVYTISLYDEILKDATKKN
ncbi:MAG: HlyD family efflux transporter periplasmic adaptor subunit [Bacillota bacterium]|nr:HlyD family efflux transporter periplasmic adaptor subunit [Bacillota bacterium]